MTPLGTDATPADVLRESFRLWNARAFEELALLFAPDVVYDATAVGDAVIEGRAALREYFDYVTDVTDFDFEVDRIVESGTRVAVVLALHGRGEHSGAPFLGWLAQVSEVRDGVIRHARWHASADQALAELDAG